MAASLPPLQGEIEFDASRATEELRKLERELERLSSGDLASYLTRVEQLVNTLAAASAKMGSALTAAVQAPAQSVAPAVDGLKQIERQANKTAAAVASATAQPDPTDFGYGGLHPSHPKHASNAVKPPPFQGVVVNSTESEDVQDLTDFYENFRKRGREVYIQIAEAQARTFAEAQLSAGTLKPDKIEEFLDIARDSVAEALFSQKQAELARQIIAAGGQANNAFIGPVQTTADVINTALNDALGSMAETKVEQFKATFFPTEGPEYRAGMPGFEQITQYIQQNAGNSGRLIMEQMVKKYDEAVKAGIPFGEEMFRRLTTGYTAGSLKNQNLTGAMLELENVGVQFPEGQFPIPTEGRTLTQTVGGAEDLARIMEGIKDKYLDVYRNSERWQKGQVTVADVMTHLASSTNRRDQYILSDLQKKLKQGYSQGFEGPALAGRVFDEPQMKSLQEHFASQGFKGQLPLLDMGKSADDTFNQMVKGLTRVNTGLDQMHAKSERVSRSSLYDERRRTILMRTIGNSMNMLAPGMMPRGVQMGMSLIDQAAYASPEKLGGLMKFTPVLASIGIAAGATGLALRTMWKGMQDSETQAFNLERMNRVFGDTKRIVEDLQGAMDGQVSAKQITAAIGGIQKNSQLSGDQKALEQLVLTAREFGQKAGVPFEQAMQQIVQAIQTGNVGALEQMGLLEDGKAALREYADAQGTAIGQLKPWETEMVLVNQVLAENNKLLSEANTPVEDAAESWDRLATSAGNAKTALIDVFADEFVTILDAATKLLNMTSATLDEIAVAKQNTENLGLLEKGDGSFDPDGTVPTPPPGGWGTNALSEEDVARGIWPDRFPAKTSGEPLVYPAAQPSIYDTTPPAFSGTQAQSDMAAMIALVGEYNQKLDELKAKLQELESARITGSEEFAANEKAKQDIEGQIAGYSALKDSAYGVFTMLAEGIEGTGESADTLATNADSASGALSGLSSNAGIAGSAMAAAAAEAAAFASTLDNLENSAISAGYALAGRLVNKLGVTGAAGYGNQFRGEADQLRSGIEDINNQRIAAGMEQIPDHIATWAFQELRENQEFVVDGFTKMGDTGVGQAERVKKAWDSTIESMISGTRKDTTEGLLPIIEDPNDKNAVDSLAASAYGDVKKLGLDPKEVALSTSAIMKGAGLGRQDEVDEPARRMLDVVKLGTKSPNYDLVKHLIPPEVQEQGEQAIREFAARMVKGHRDGVSNALYDTGAAVDQVIQQIQGKIAQQDFVKDVQAALQAKRDAGEALPGMSDDEILKAMGVDTTPERMAKAMENQGMTLEQILKGISELPADLMEIDPGAPNPLVAAAQIEADDETALKGSGTTAGTVAGDAFVAQVETGNYGGAAVQKILDGIASKEQELKDSGADAAAWWGSAFTDYIGENTPAELYKIMVPDLVPLLEAALKQNSERES